MLKLSASLLSDQKPFWIWVNKTKRGHPVPPILYDDVLVASDVDKAHCFNEYLSPVFTIEEVSSVAFLYRKLDVIGCL